MTTIDPRKRHWRSLSNAYMTWFKSQPAVLKDEVIAMKRQGRVCLRFPRYRTLRGRVWSNCLAVEAVNERGLCHPLFDVDSLPILWEEARVIVCGFCENEQMGFDSREALWEHHLFEPFADFVTRKLRHAEGIRYLRIGKKTRALLRMPTGWDASDDPEFENGGVEHLRFYRRGRP